MGPGVTMKNTTRLFAVTLALALSACASWNDLPNEEALAQAGAVRLNDSEVKAHVIGRTEEWIHGGAYYVDHGMLRVKWRKTYYSGSWEVSTDGKLCYQLPRWDRRCHFYMRKDGEVFMFDEGRNIGVRPMFDGDRLNSLGRYNSGADRRQ